MAVGAGCCEAYVQRAMISKRAELWFLHRLNFSSEEVSAVSPGPKTGSHKAIVTAEEACHPDQFFRRAESMSFGANI